MEERPFLNCFRPEQAAGNANAGALQLTGAELARIDAAFLLYPGPRGLLLLWASDALSLEAGGHTPITVSPSRRQL